MDVLRNLAATIGELRTIFDSFNSKDSSRQSKWTRDCHGDVSKLKARIEAHRSTVSLALDMTYIMMRATVQRETTSLQLSLVEEQAGKSDNSRSTILVPQIKEDTTHLLNEISILKEQLQDMRNQYDAQPFAINRFLSQTSLYAESVLDDPVAKHALASVSEQGKTISQPKSCVVSMASATGEPVVYGPFSVQSAFVYQSGLEAPGAFVSPEVTTSVELSPRIHRNSDLPDLNSVFALSNPALFALYNSAISIHMADEDQLAARDDPFLQVRAVARRGREAATDDELTISIGQPLLVLDNTNEYWAFVRSLPDKQVGYIPIDLMTKFETSRTWRNLEAIEKLISFLAHEHMSPVLISHRNVDISKAHRRPLGRREYQHPKLDHDKLRVWSSIRQYPQGVRAQFVRLDQEFVVLRRFDGKMMSILRDKLDRNDTHHLSQMRSEGRTSDDAGHG